LRQITLHAGLSRLAAAAALLSGAALAQVVYESADFPAEPAEAAEEARRYQVEMVVFEHTDGRDTVQERFLPEVGPQELPAIMPALKAGEVPPIGRIGPVGSPGYGAPLSVFDAAAAGAADSMQGMDRNSPEYRRWVAEQPLTEVPSHILQTELKVLDPETYAMPDIYRTLERLGAYKPIMRAAWTQAVHEKDETLSIDLRRLGPTPLYLDGKVTLYLSRYLHLVMDLVIDAGDTVLEEPRRSQGRFYGDARTQNYFDQRYGIATAPVRYRIEEDRIFRSGEIRYYDHPKFGVVARITRVEEPGASTGNGGSLPPAN